MKVKIDVYEDHAGDITFVYLGNHYLFYAKDAPACNWKDICYGITHGFYAYAEPAERHLAGGKLGTVTVEV